ncbi:MAG TPA: cytochrome P460 family protein [Bryobacteraceae bacterium]|nr:cytochrome P460 family protein [Bryobacteraceae bacterium]
MKRVVALALFLTGIAAAQTYTKAGELVLPNDYREWLFLSSGIGMSYNAAGQPAENPDFENVFVNPAAYRAFMKTGTWPDKTVLLLEIRGSDSRASINKAGRFQTGVLRVEAHVKDSSRGGWAFYGFNKGSRTGTLFPKTANCYSCHEQNGAVDSAFVQFYPTLIDAAKKNGTFKKTAE